MKTKSFLLLASAGVLGLSAWGGFAPPGSDWQLSERGPDHRRWTRVNWSTNQSGVVGCKTNSLVELGTGLHRQLNGQWTLTQPRIEPATNGAVCVGARHSAWLARNLNTRAAVLIRTPEGNWLKANVLGLAYHDASSGRSVTIARLKDCVGEIVGTNTVIYRDAFADLRADVRYTYSRAGFEQDIILRQRPPLPEAYGLNAATTRLLVMTEFLDTPAPARVAQDARLTETQPNRLAALTARLAGMTNRSELGALLAKWRGMVARAHEREATLDFGGMRVGGGRAFELPPGTNEAAASSLSNIMALARTEAKLKAAVRKEWRRMDGRDFLIERVNVREVREQLQKLPLMAQAGAGKTTEKLPPEVRDTLPMPGPLLAAGEPASPMQVAQIEPEESGFVLDWNMVPTSYTDFTFEAGTTYIVSEDCYLDGTTTIQDGAVIKFAAGAWPSLHIAGPVICPASGTAYFTSTEDDSVGEAVSQGYGFSGGAMYGTALDIDGWSAGPCLLQNLEFRYGMTGVALSGSWGASVEHLLNNCIFTDCHDALNLNSTRVRMNGGSISLNSGYGANEAISGNDYHLTLVGAALAGYPFVAADGRDPGSSQSSLVILQDCSVSGEITTSGPVVVAVNPPVVSVTATDFQATKGTSDTGEFTVTITGDASQILAVDSVTAGTAVENVDYTGIPNYVTFPTGQSSVSYTVTPGTPNAEGPGSATATLKLLEMPSQWLVEPPGEDTVFITDLTAPGYPAPLGVVAWWRGQGNAQDSVGTNHGTLSNGAGLDTSAGYDSGMIGNAFRLHNASAGNSSDPGAHIIIPDAAALRPAAVTVEVWVKFTEADTQNNPWPGRQVIAAKPGSGGVEAYVLRKEGDRFNFAVGSASGAQVAATSTTVIQLNRWYHVAGSYDPADGQVRIYVNGVLQDTQSASFALGYASGYLYLGMGIPGGISSYANLCGLIDELAIYERALATNEIASIFSIATRGKTYDPLDKDADALPDAWELTHFGNLNEGPNGDYDGDGMTNAEEKLAGTDPNTIGFVVWFDATYTASTTPTGSAEVRGGHPSWMVALVDTDPHTLTPAQIEALAWQACPASTQTGSMLTVSPTLAADGWHTVWVGMCGAASNALPTWNSARVKLDRVAPVVHLTSPSGSVVPYRRVQVAGYAEEALAEVRYDHASASQSATNVLAFVTASTETSSEFQAFDVNLAPGETNHFTLRVFDRAGNETTLNLNLQVDAGTPPPTSANIVWPPDGMRVCGDSCTIYGNVADPAATISATVTDSLGESVSRVGWVSRDGHYYIENIPVRAGQNTLSVTVADGLGRSVTANSTFQRADYLVTAYVGELDRVETRTGGSIEKVYQPPEAPPIPDIASISVNGVAKALEPTTGQWWQNLSVPVDKEQSVFPFQVVLTPESGPPSELLKVYLKPVYARFGTNVEGYAVSGDCPGQGYGYATSYTNCWTDDTATVGQAHSSYWHWQAGTAAESEIYEFPRDRFLVSDPWRFNDKKFYNSQWTRVPEPGRILTPSKDITYDSVEPGVGPNELPIWVPDIRASYRDIDFDWWSFDLHPEDGDETTHNIYFHKWEDSIFLETGGRPGDFVPIQLDLGLNTVGDDWHWWQDYAWNDWNNPIYQSFPTNNSGIDLGGLGKTDENGRLWVMAPANAHIEITPRLEGGILKRITAIHRETGGAFKWANISVTPSALFNATVDSDNDGSVEQDGNDDRVEDNGAGQIMLVNDGDEDHDGTPNWADFEVNGESQSFGTLGTIRVRMPAAPQCETFRLRFNYEGSDPNGINFSADPLVPAPGKLRLWKPTMGATRSPAAAPAGDYIEPGHAYTLAELGYPGPYIGGPQVMELKTEIVRPSTAAGDIRVAVELDPDGAGSTFGYCQVDEVRLTGIGVQLVEAISDTTVVVRTNIVDSHPAPYFTNLVVQTVGPPHPNGDGTKLLGSFVVSGRVRSALCDLIPGVEATLGSLDGQGLIQDIAVSLNGEPLPTPTHVAFQQIKRAENEPLPSFLKPFETYTDFELVFTDVEVSTGVNFLRLAASDKVPGVGLTGYAEYSWDVTATYTPPDSPRNGIDLSPITYRELPATLDFGSSVSSLADLQAGVPVRLKLNIETNELAVPGEWQVPPEFDDDLHVVESTLTQSAILFTNANAWVVVHGREQLDYFLQGYGTYQDLVAQVSIPSLELTNVTTRWRAEGVTPGKLRHEYTAATLQFQTNALTGEIEAADVIVKRVGVGAVTNTLLRSGTSDTFTSANNETTITFSGGVQQVYEAGEPLTFTASDTALGLVNEPLVIIPTGSAGQYLTQDDLSSDLPDGVTNPGYNAYAGWSFQNAPPQVVAQSLGGEMHVYYTRFVGPNNVLEAQARQFTTGMIKAVDGFFYAMKHNPGPAAGETPWSHVMLAMKNIRPMPEWNGPADLLAEQAGFLFGINIQAAEDIQATAEFFTVLPFQSGKYLYAEWQVAAGRATEQQIKHVVAVETDIENASAFLRECWNLWKINSGYEVYKAAATLDLDEANRQSELCAWSYAYLVDLIIAVNNEYQQANAFKRGEIKGRLTLEAVALLLPFTKAGQAAHLSKVEFIQKLKLTQTVQGDAQLVTIAGKLENLAAAVDPPPLIKGITADGNPLALTKAPPPFAPASVDDGAKLGGLAERWVGGATMETANSTKVGNALGDTLAQIRAMPAAKGVELFRRGQDLLIIRVPQAFASASGAQTVTVEEAKRVIAELMKYKHWKQFRQNKELLVVFGSEGEELVLLGSKAGVFQGHHIIEDSMITLLKRDLDGFRFFALEGDQVPVKILTQAEHIGKESGLHLKMWYEWENGVRTSTKTRLHPDRLREFEDAQKMMDALIEFYDANEYSELARVTRAWCRANNVPFTK